MMTSLPLSLEMRQASFWGEVRMHAPKLLPAGWGLWKQLYIVPRPHEVVFFPEAHFTVGDRVKSLKVIQYRKHRVPAGSLGTIVALEPKMRVKWDAFSTLDNAVVTEGQIENLKDVTHRQAHSIVKCDGVEPAVEDIRMVTLRKKGRTVAWLRFPDVQTRQAFILSARPQILKVAVVVPPKKSSIVAFFNKWTAPRVSTVKKELVLDSIVPTGDIVSKLEKDCNDLKRAMGFSICSLDTTDSTEGEDALDEWWMDSSKSSLSVGPHLINEQDESTPKTDADSPTGRNGDYVAQHSARETNPDYVVPHMATPYSTTATTQSRPHNVPPLNLQDITSSRKAATGACAPNCYAMSDTACPSFHAMSDTAGPSFHAMSDTAGPSFIDMNETPGPSFHELSDGMGSFSDKCSDGGCEMYEQMATPKRSIKTEISRDELDCLLSYQLF